MLDVSPQRSLLSFFQVKLKRLIVIPTSIDFLLVRRMKLSLIRTAPNSILEALELLIESIDGML